MKRRNKIENEIYGIIAHGVRDNFLKEVVNLTNLNNEALLHIPYLIEKYYNHKDLVNYNRKWNWVDEYEIILEIELNRNEYLANKFNKTFDDAVELEIQNKLTTEFLSKNTKLIATIIASNIPRKCFNIKNLNRFEEILYELCKSNKKFEINQLKSKLKSFVDNFRSLNIHIREPELEDLSIMLLSTNDELELILNRIDSEVRENIINILKTLVVSIIKSNNSSYFELMDQIDKKIKDMYNIQSTNLNPNLDFEHPILLNFKEGKNLNNYYSFTIKQIIRNRNDVDFFEFIHISKLNPYSSTVSTNEGLLNVTSQSISGIIPSQNVEYTYLLHLVYTYLKDGSKRNVSIKVKIVFCNHTDQCEKAPVPQENKECGLIIIILVVLGIAAIAIEIFCRINFRSNNTQDQIVPNENNSGVGDIDKSDHSLDEEKTNEANTISEDGSFTN